MIIMRRVRVLSLALLILVTVFFLGYVKETKTAENVTNFTYWCDEETHKLFWEDAVARWNKTYPDKPIKLATSIYPYDDLHVKLLMAYQSGIGAPDIADIEITKFSNFIKGKIPPVVELNSIVDPVKDKIVMCRIENYAKDGKYYGIDYHVGAEVMFYNKELLDKAGVNADDIKTWDDYIAAGKKVVAATGKPMTTLDTQRHYAFYPLILMQGSDFFDKDGNVILDNDVNVKTLQFLKDMIYKDKIAITIPGGQPHAEEYWTWMNKGNAASIWMPFWYTGRFVENMPDLKGKIIIRPMPEYPGGKKTAGLGGTAVCISNQSKNIELMKQLLAEAMLSKEGSIKTWTMLGFDPIRKDAWDDPAMSALNKYTDYFGRDIFKVIRGMVEDVGGVNLTENYSEAMALVQQIVMFKVLAEQSQSPKEALESAANELRKK
jgi:arabinosaccharide transport system substrate-binding protein